jgi:hypothetical protein
MTVLKGEEKYLANVIVKAVINSLFTQGHLTETDLSLSQEEFFNKIKDLLDKSDLVIAGIDHRESIIEKADNLILQNDYDYAKVLYAMFFEHSINYLISHECEKRKFEEKVKIEIIKSVDIYGKLTWLFKLLGFPKFNDKYRLIIKKLSDDRNSFVHYKWKIENFDEKDETKQLNDEKEIKKIKLAIKYMKKYETNLLYQKNKSRLHKKLKHK